MDKKKPIIEIVPKHKIVFLGDQGVGKSSLASRFVYDIYEEKYQPTIGIDFFTRTLFLDDLQLRLQVWDTAGQERFRCLIPSYIRDAEVALIVYDVTNADSFDSLGSWIRMVREDRGDDIILIIIGNKTDKKEHKRQVTEEAGRTTAEHSGAIHIETSARTGYNVKQLFRTLAKLLCSRNSEQHGVPFQKTQDKEEAIKLSQHNDVQEKHKNPASCQCTQ